jgi:hypothetical protein
MGMIAIVVLFVMMAAMLFISMGLLLRIVTLLEEANLTETQIHVHGVDDPDFAGKHLAEALRREPCQKARSMNVTEERIVKPSDIFEDYVKRCLATDGFVVMKSDWEAKRGQLFWGAQTKTLGTIFANLVVMDAATAEEARVQALRIAGVRLGPKDLNAKWFYRVGIDDGPKRPIF